MVTADLAAAYRLFADFVCDDSAAEAAYAAIVALYKRTLPFNPRFNCTLLCSVAAESTVAML